MVNVSWERQLVLSSNFNFVTLQGALLKFFLALVNTAVHSMSYCYFSFYYYNLYYHYLWHYSVIFLISYFTMTSFYKVDQLMDF